MKLIGFNRDELGRYLGRQIDRMFPDGATDSHAMIDRDLDEALDRLEHCIGAVRMWRPGEFTPLQSEQNTIFLYYLANTIYRNRGAGPVCTKLFYLNKALNGFHCFYDTELPDIFFIGHSLGIVLVRTTYSNYLVLYQNSTVGKNHGAAPVLGEGVVMYPNSAIIGDCNVRPGSIIAQGQSLMDADTPGNCYVFTEGGKPVFKKPKRDVLADIFRLDEMRIAV